MNSPQRDLSPINTLSYLFDFQPTPTRNVRVYDSDDELLDTIDAIVAEQERNDEYDVSDSDDDKQPEKRVRVEDPILENQKGQVLKLYGCQQKITNTTSQEEREIHEWIQQVFNRMRETVNK